MTVSGFSDQDVKTAKLVGNILATAKFTVDIKQAIELYQCLAWLQTLPGKIDANVSELLKMTMPETRPKSKGRK